MNAAELDRARRGGVACRGGPALPPGGAARGDRARRGGPAALGGSPCRRRLRRPARTQQGTSPAVPHRRDVCRALRPAAAHPSRGLARPALGALARAAGARSRAARSRGLGRVSRHAQRSRAQGRVLDVARAALLLRARRLLRAPGRGRTPRRAGGRDLPARRRRDARPGGSCCATRPTTWWRPRCTGSCRTGRCATSLVARAGGALRSACTRTLRSSAAFSPWSSRCCATGAQADAHRGRRAALRRRGSRRCRDLRRRAGGRARASPRRRGAHHHRARVPRVAQRAAGRRRARRTASACAASRSRAGASRRGACSTGCCTTASTRASSAAARGRAQEHARRLRAWPDALQEAFIRGQGPHAPDLHAHLRRRPTTGSCSSPTSIRRRTTAWPRSRKGGRGW